MAQRAPVTDYPLIALAGPTASGKTALALHLAEALNGEIISCDSVAVYRLMEIGTAKPSPAERAEIPHHCLDLYSPDEPCTAGDWARHARTALASIRSRNRLPIIAGGTGLYLRALLQGLAPAPPRDEALRARLRTRAATRPASLHRLLRRFDPVAATAIHPNDTPKLIRSLEVTLASTRPATLASTLPATHASSPTGTPARTPQSEQWQAGRDALTGYRVLHLGLAPARALLYDRIDTRAAAMFTRGLVAETAALRARFGDTCRPLGSLGYAQAMQLLRNEITLTAAIAAAQQGHRNYAKRQLTWFRREPAMHWLPTPGDKPTTQAEALHLTRLHLESAPR